MTKLVIVESPAKARTIEKYLGKDYKVAASVGHVVDLPRKDLGVDLAHDFAPRYEVMPEKRKAVAALREAAKGADEIFLAPDPDREGEAIAWHLADLLAGLKKPMHRVLINEITRPAVLQAVKDAGKLNRSLFEAQQARRILDRLVGYLISPMLSKKFRSGLSAGRVQSVALRLVVERERAIRAFIAKEYWSIEARLAGGMPPSFVAKLAALGGKGLELPERFDKNTNTYVPIDSARHTFIPDRASAGKIVDSLRGRTFKVGEVTTQERRRNPQPPFITSTLQQEAARKLGFTAKKTMSLAQKLYEGIEVGGEPVGLITYMRTDAPRVAAPAQDMARDYINNTYGKEYLPAHPPVYRSKKGAQEAHEAVRPTSTERTPDAVRPYLDRDAHRLYELIFLRFVASQMNPAVYDQTTVEIPVDECLFRANGRVLKFKGFLAVYEESTDDEPATDEEAALPPLRTGQELKLEELVPAEHFTRPPPRFTEASLVKELEERGVGRPSTYASILSTIQERSYVEKELKQFAPTPLGERIIDILVQAFPDTFNVNFTARMENDLDQVEDGEKNWVILLREFYGPFSAQLALAPEIMDSARQEEPTDIACPRCGQELVIKWSRNGEFIGCGAYPECKFTTDFTRGEGGAIELEEDLAAGLVCEKCGSPMVIKKTRKGGREFLACSAYPDCTNSKDFERVENGELRVIEREDGPDTGIVCDKCGAAMVVKKTLKGGREFLACSGYPKCKNAKDFDRDDAGKVRVLEREVSDDPNLKCEKCGKPLVVRRTRSSGKEFLACSGYPKCKNAKDMVRDADGKVKIVEVGDEIGVCEKCGKPMVLKRGRRGTFAACSGYPECQNIEGAGAAGAAAGAGGATGAKPAVEALPDEPPCENCGKPMVRRVGRFGPFISCSGYPECKNIRKKKKEGPAAKSSAKAESADAPAPEKKVVRRKAADPKPASGLVPAADDTPKPAAAPAGAPAGALSDEAPCELCGKPMVQRVGRFGPFIACSGYPQCKNIRKKKK